jgi:hypothetical protein
LKKSRKRSQRNRPPGNESKSIAVEQVPEGKEHFLNEKFSKPKVVNPQSFIQRRKDVFGLQLTYRALCQAGK